MPQETRTDNRIKALASRGAAVVGVVTVRLVASNKTIKRTRRIQRNTTAFTAASMAASLSRAIKTGRRRSATTRTTTFSFKMHARSGETHIVVMTVGAISTKQQMSSSSGKVADQMARRRMAIFTGSTVTQVPVHLTYRIFASATSSQLCACLAS